MFDKLKKLQIYQEIHQLSYVAVPMRTEVEILARGNRGEKQADKPCKDAVG